MDYFLGHPMARLEAALAMTRVARPRAIRGFSDCPHAAMNTNIMPDIIKLTRQSRTDAELKLE